MRHRRAIIVLSVCDMLNMFMTIGAICDDFFCMDERQRVRSRVGEYGFDDFTNPSVFNSSNYLTSILDSAPCPPPWKTELLCSSDPRLSCQYRVYLLEKCLRQMKSNMFQSFQSECNVVNYCKSTLKCNEFSDTFSDKIFQCRGYSVITDSPQTTKTIVTTVQKIERTSLQIIKLSTPSNKYSTLERTTEYNTDNSSVHITPSSDLNDTIYNVTLGTPKPQEREEEDDSGPLVGLIIAVLILVLIVIVVVVLYVVHRRQKKYQVTLRQWSTTSRSPLTKTSDGYDICCFQCKRLLPSKQTTYYTVTPADDHDADETKSAIDIVLENEEETKRLTNGDVTSADDYKTGSNGNVGLIRKGSILLKDLEKELQFIDDDSGEEITSKDSLL